MLVYDNEETMLDWARVILESPLRDDARAFGWMVNGVLRAVVAYDDFTTTNMNIHVASDGRPGWLTRSVLVAAFHYPFISCGVDRVTAVVPADNHKALRLNQHLGFRYEGLCEQAPGKTDLVILGMIKHRCRFLPQEMIHE